MIKMYNCRGIIEPVITANLVWGQTTTHRERVRAEFAARRESLYRAAALYTALYLRRFRK